MAAQIEVDEPKFQISFTLVVLDVATAYVKDEQRDEQNEIKTTEDIWGLV